MEKLILAVQKVLMVAGLFVGLTIGSDVKAQILTMPSGAASLWTNVSSYALTGINCAMIDYMVMGSPTGLCGIAYFDAGSPVGIFDVYDPNPSSLPGATPFVGTPIGNPDIVIGNNTSSPTTDYVVAVAYPDASGLVVEFWDMYDDGVTACTVTHGGRDYTYPGTVSTVHIDLIAQYGSTGATGLPLSSKFVVTWDSAGTILAAYGDLLTGVSSGPVTIASGIMPDVAAIQRVLGGSTHDIALITYTDASNANLYYREWDVTAASVSGATTLDAMAMGDAVTIPRIDALDNYNTNGGSSISNYKVVAQVDSSSFNIIRTYDNLTAGTGTPFWTSSSIITLPGGYSAPPYQHFAPTVALGGPSVSAGLPHDGTEYLVQHFTDYSSSTSDIVMLEPIGISNPYWLALTLGVDRYYWVCDHAPDPITYGVYANAVSNSVNHPVDNSFHVWGQDDAVSGTDIKYKFSPSPHGFKTQPAGKENHASTWQIFPNPASDFVTIACPSEKEGAYYQVVDMPGHVVLNGKLQNGSQQVNLSSLVSGTYILKLSREDGAGKQHMFVKQ